MDKHIRIAWIGGGVGTDGGVGTFGLHILDEALKLGAEIEVFSIGDNGRVPKRFIGRPGLSIVEIPHNWSWDRWYSRNRLLAFSSNLGTRTLSYRKMIQRLRELNAENPYDIIFQMSQTELFNLKRYLNELPPLVVFPCVHAAGELHWHRREGRYARQVENSVFNWLVRAYLNLRAIFQKRELGKPAMVIGMSDRFNELIRQDYGVDASRQAVIYNAIEPSSQEGFGRTEANISGRPLRVLFVARISVRKGVEQIVELSKRLDDLAGKVELHVIGGATLWSDYRGHLKELNPRIARYMGGLPHDKIVVAMDEADVLVLPSHYEPGGIVVGEALSRGVPVVVSDEVGSAEPIEGDCCRRFKAGDMDAFERETRAMLTAMSLDPKPLREQAMSQARTHFAPEVIGAKFVQILRYVAARGRRPVAEQVVDQLAGSST